MGHANHTRAAINRWNLGLTTPVRATSRVATMLVLSARLKINDWPVGSFDEAAGLFIAPMRDVPSGARVETVVVSSGDPFWVRHRVIWSAGLLGKTL